MVSGARRIKYYLDTRIKYLGLKVFKRLEGIRKFAGNGKQMKTITQIDSFEMLIDGEIRPSESGAYFDSINPSTGEVFTRIADASLKDMRMAIQAARNAFESGVWSSMSLAERGIYLKRIAKMIRDEAKELASLETLDTGKTIKQTTFIDVPTCADCFEYFSNVGANACLPDRQGRPPLQATINPVDAPVKSLLMREPMGVVGCIIPWNYPLIMAAWKIAPALMAGNTIVFKPSSTASVSVLKLAQIIQKAGLPKGVVNIVTSSRHEVASELARSPQVDMLSFTGGTETGKELMRLAAGNVKKLSMELGGKSPNIVFADCDLEAAMGGTLSAIFMNQGQMCTAGSRLLLQNEIYDKFLETLIQRTKALKIGDASRYDTDFGPLVSARQRSEVLSHIEKGQREGARLLCGGEIPNDPELAKGFYLEPTIFSEVKNDMAIAQEEIFGPVLAVMRFFSKEEAIKIANDSPYGLAACVWTKDFKKADEVAQKLKCGTVWINTYGGFYNEAPYGGYKQSGFGRELGVEGLLEYTQTKHVCTDMTPGGKSLVSSWF